MHVMMMSAQCAGVRAATRTYAVRPFHPWCLPVLRIRILDDARPLAVRLCLPALQGTARQEGLMDRQGRLGVWFWLFSAVWLFEQQLFARMSVSNGRLQQTHATKSVVF